MAAFRVSCTPSPDPPRRPAPCLDIGPHPNQTRGQVGDRAREIRVPAAKVVHVDGSLVAQSSGDLGSAHKLLHVDFPSHCSQPNPGPPRNWGLRMVICILVRGVRPYVTQDTGSGPQRNPRNAAAGETPVRTRPDVARPGVIMATVRRASGPGRPDALRSDLERATVELGAEPTLPRVRSPRRPGRCGHQTRCVVPVT